jgi:hypothetical protein
MSLGVCIPDLVANGAIRAEKAEEVTRLYDDLRVQYEARFDPDTAAAMATQKTLDAMEKRAKANRRDTLKQMAAQLRAVQEMRRYGGGLRDGEPINPRAALALMDRDDFARYSNVAARAKAVKAETHGMIDQLLAAQRKRVTGQLRDKAGEADMVRAAFGENVDSLNAREIGKAVTDALEYQRRRFNAAGGHIGKLDNYGLPQSHSSRLVRAVPFAEWRDFITPKLAIGRMIDRDTGAPFTAAKLESVLRDVYEGIRTEGYDSRKPGGVGGKALFNRHAEERFLQFGSADDWMAYNERFGAAGPFDSLMGHIERMSRDIAAMEVLGPNPDATIRFVQDELVASAQKLEGDQGKAIDAAKAGASRLGDLWDEYMGRNQVPESRRLALGFSAFRAVQTSAKLGGAILSATGDFAMSAYTRRFNGLSETALIGDYLKLFRPGSVEDQRAAIRMGAIADHWADTSAAMNRLTGEELTGEWSRRLADFTLRASGLSRHTMALRSAHAMQVVSMMTGESGKSWDRLHKDFRSMLDRYGIGAQAWDSIRKSEKVQDRGAEWLMPRAIADQQLRNKVLEMIHSEVDFAVPTVDLRTRTTMNSIGKRGTWAGEIARSAFLFKSFGITVLATHGRRTLDQQGAFNKLRYAASLTVLTTLAGALSIQLKELQKGRDPAPMRDKTFWAKAMAQGGGWGIFGDFVGASENRFGGGLSQTLAGPTAQTASNVADLTIGNGFRLARGEDTKFWDDTLKIMRQEVPVLSSLWYAKPVYDRMLLQTLDRMIDPDHDANVARLIRKAEDQGTGYYLPPDMSMEEARAPALGNALAAPPEE